jgi:hypothetical protein
MKVCPGCKKSSKLLSVRYPKNVTETLEPVVSENGKLLGFDDWDSTEVKSDNLLNDVFCPDCGYNYFTNLLATAWDKMVEKP